MGKRHLRVSEIEDTPVPRDEKFLILVRSNIAIRSDRGDHRPQWLRKADPR